MVKAIATHLIKVEGVWREGEEDLHKFVRAKVREIDSYFSPDTELIKLEGDRAEVWVLISTLMDSGTVEEMVGSWVKKHLQDVELTGIRVEELSEYHDLRSGRMPRYAILLG